MDISQAAFGLDMRSASRIYFLGPVLNPQVEAQAIGRARRISQRKPVTVETLVLRGSIEELIVHRRRCMTQAEHRRVSSVLDDRPMYEWITNARIMPMDGDGGDGLAQTAALRTPQFVFGRGFGRKLDPDEGLLSLGGDSGNTTPDTKKRNLVGVVKSDVAAPGMAKAKGPLRIKLINRSKRPRSPAPLVPTDDDGIATSTSPDVDADGQHGQNDVGSGSAVSVPLRQNPTKRRRARIAWADHD